jgi:hypothetical protein
MFVEKIKSSNNSFRHSCEGSNPVISLVLDAPGLKLARAGLSSPA